MRKFKFLIILVITSFLFVPFFVNAADTCEIYEGGQCYEITGVANSNPTSISDFTISGSLVDFNFTEFEMDLFRNENSSVMATNISNHLIWLCNFKNKGVDADGWGVCEKKINTDKSFNYQCTLTGDNTAINITTCRENLPKTSTPSSSSSSSSSSASSTTSSTVSMYQGSAAKTFGEGFVQCGTRKIECKPSGWLSSLSTQCACCGQCTPDDILVVANTALKWLFGIVGALGLLMFVYGGGMWIMSRGDSGMIGKGKSALVNTVIGLIIMFASSAIIVALQKGIGLDSSVQVTVTGSNSFTSTTNKDAPKVDNSIKYGIIKLGDSCKILKSSKETQCAEGMYCYAKSGAAGTCLPRNPKADVAGGAECWALPGGKTMCKSGNCQIAGQTVAEAGKKGTCEQKKDIGDSCMRLEGSKSECNKGLYCYNESSKKGVQGVCLPKSDSSYIKSVKAGGVCYKLAGSSTMCVSGTCQTASKAAVGTAGVCPVPKSYGETCAKNSDCIDNGTCTNKKCLPADGRNIAYEGSCYVIPGSGTNDCASDLKCIPSSQQASFHGESRKTGAVGNCLGYKSIPNDGSMCSHNYECSSGGMCYEVGGSKGCISSDFEVNIHDEGASCRRYVLQGTGLIIHSCQSGLTCDAETGYCVKE